MDSAQVGIFEKTDEVCFASLLESHDGGALESEISLEILGDFSYQTLEWELSDQKFGALLVTTDLSESYCSGSVSVRFLHSTGSGGALSSSLGGQLFSWGFASSRFTGSLLCTSHLDS